MTGDDDDDDNGDDNDNDNNDDDDNDNDDGDNELDEEDNEVDGKKRKKKLIVLKYNPILANLFVKVFRRVGQKMTYDGKGGPERSEKG